MSKYCCFGHMQAKNNTPAAQGKCITRLLLYHFCVNLPLMMASYPVFRAMGMRSSFPLPSWYYQVPLVLKLFFFLWVLMLNSFNWQFKKKVSVLASWKHLSLCLIRSYKTLFWWCSCRKEVSAQILFYFIIEDFVFYWGHRILHSKWLYKNVHSVHHE